MQKKKHFFNPKLIATIMVVILACCLVFAIYLHFNQKDPNIITAVNSSPSSTSIPKTDDLPDEAKDVNSYQYLVNKTYGSLAKDFEPGDLVDPENVESSSGVFTVRQEVATKLEEMVKAAKDANITILVSSGYVSYSEQELLYTSYSSLGEASASVTCEKAGYSEHQLGLAVDLTDSADTPSQSVSFKDTDAGKWLAEHAHEYGFILRYPKGKENITGYSYMPWHYRYVGVDLANAMYAEGPDYTLEEYYGLSK